MGYLKDQKIEEGERQYWRNHYNHDVQRIKRTMRLYADRPSFAAKLQKELEQLKADRKGTA